MGALPRHGLPQGVLGIPTCTGPTGRDLGLADGAEHLGTPGCLCARGDAAPLNTTKGLAGGPLPLPAAMSPMAQSTTSSSAAPTLLSAAPRGARMSLGTPGLSHRAGEAPGAPHGTWPGPRVAGPGQGATSRLLRGSNSLPPVPRACRELAWHAPQPQVPGWGWCGRPEQREPSAGHQARAVGWNPQPQIPGAGWVSPRPRLCLRWGRDEWPFQFVLSCVWREPVCWPGPEQKEPARDCSQGSEEGAGQGSPRCGCSHCCSAQTGWRELAAWAGRRLGEGHASALPAPGRGAVSRGAHEVWTMGTSLHMPGQGDTPRMAAHPSPGQGDVAAHPVHGCTHLAWAGGHGCTHLAWLHTPCAWLHTPRLGKGDTAAHTLHGCMPCAWLYTPHMSAHTSCTAAHPLPGQGGHGCTHFSWLRSPCTAAHAAWAAVPWDVSEPGAEGGPAASGAPRQRCHEYWQGHGYSRL